MEDGHGVGEQGGKIGSHLLDERHFEADNGEMGRFELLVGGSEGESLAGLAAEGVGDVNEGDEEAVVFIERGGAVMITCDELAGTGEFPLFAQGGAHALMVGAYQLCFDIAEMLGCGLGAVADFWHVVEVDL